MGTGSDVDDAANGDDDGDASVVSFDTDAALDAARRSCTGRLYSFVAYTPDEFAVVYVDDDLEELYPNRDVMLEHFEQIHSYVHVDFMERNLFEDTLFSELGTVRTFVTGMDGMTLVRILRDREGIFVSLDPDEAVTDVVAAIRTAIEERD